MRTAASGSETVMGSNSMPGQSTTVGYGKSPLKVAWHRKDIIGHAEKKSVCKFGRILVLVTLLGHPLISKATPSTMMRITCKRSSET